jgi:hypothetical protein
VDLGIMPSVFFALWIIKHTCFLVLPTPGIGFGKVQDPIGFYTWIQLDLDIVGYGHPYTLDPILLDFVGQRK